MIKKLLTTTALVVCLTGIAQASPCEYKDVEKSDYTLTDTVMETQTIGISELTNTPPLTKYMVVVLDTPLADCVEGTTVPVVYLELFNLKVNPKWLGHHVFMKGDIRRTLV